MIPELAKTAPTNEIQIRINEKMILVSTVAEVVNALKEFALELASADTTDDLTTAQFADLNRLVHLGGDVDGILTDMRERLNANRIKEGRKKWGMT